VQTSGQQLATENWQLATRLVGRDAELTQLHGWLEKALNGERQIVFVTGEAGIGKTTVVDTFLKSLASGVQRLAVKQVQGPNLDPTPNLQSPIPVPWIARGQCIAHYGAGEAYLPVLDALGRLCHEPSGQRLIELLSQYAPTWLVHLPWFLSAADLEGLRRKIQGVRRERMLREMAEALEVITAERPLVLVLEDLHWSDPSTFDLLSFLATRRQRARLLLIGTYRSEEVLENGHPLRSIAQALRLHGQCDELPLKLLTEAAVISYLAARFAIEPREQLQKLARLVYQRTEGHPLFLVNVVDDFLARGVLAEVDGRWELREEQEKAEQRIPANLQQLIEQQIDHLSLEEQRVLEAASVVGVEFSAAAVAAGVEGEVVQVEQSCAALSRRGRLLQACGTREWPDGTVAGQYRFIHALYQHVLYERLTPGWRLRLHRRIGRRMEDAYGTRAREIAAELATHFEQGRDAGRAVQYLQQAAGTALHRCAYSEAVRHLSRALELLVTLPDTPERTHAELLLQTRLGWMLQFTQGAASAEAERTYTRVLALCRREEHNPQLLSALLGLRGFYMVRGELQTAYKLAEQSLSLARKMQQILHLLLSYNALGETLSSLGDLISARTHLEEALTLDARRYLPVRVSSLSLLAGALWALGYPDQARKRIQESLSLAREQENPYSEVVALLGAASLHLSSREWQPAYERAEAAMKITAEQGFTDFYAQAVIRHGRALVELGRQEEGIAEIRTGLAAYLATGAELARPYFLALLAGAYNTAGQAEKGLSILPEALDAAHKTGQLVQEAWLYWLKGQLTLQQEARD
jgi:predicted ATPase